jgi:hypothetical protein
LETASFIESKLTNIKNDELIILTGDLNLSALPLNEKCIQIINNQETVDKLNEEYL